jgi:sphingomyelin phosphodiesterase acid-like 3
MLYRFIAGIVLAMLAQTSIAFDMTLQTKHAEKFLSVADVHFNPFATCSPSITPCPLIVKLQAAPAQDWKTLFETYDNTKNTYYGSDSNYVLLKSTLKEVSLVVQQEQPRFAFLLGDLLAHNYHAQYVLYSHDRSSAGYQNFVTKTFQFLTREFRQAIPQIDIYPALGNNDAYEDYEVDANGRLLRQNASIMAVLITDRNNRRSFQQSYPYGGYYAVDVPRGNSQRILVLDTVLFSRKAIGHGVRQAALAQLTWLHKQLATATREHRSVILACHIPVGVDVYATLKGFLGQIVEFWEPEYSAAFDRELQEFPGTVKAVLPAHIHMDSFQIMKLTQKSTVPVSFTPAISPIYGNNPGFKMFSYDADTFNVHNYETYYLPLSGNGTWEKEYSFRQVYQAPCQNCDLTHGIKALTPEGTGAEAFKQFYSLGTGSQFITKDNNWLPYYWCDIHSISSQQYQTCIQQ